MNLTNTTNSNCFDAPLATNVPAHSPLTPLNRSFVEHQLLPKVFKPARYLGIEYGIYQKDPAQAQATMCFVFPELYEIGVSNYGHKLLYSVVNNHPDYLCDRAYAPDKDMRSLLKAEAIPLYGLETLLPLTQFDLLAFSLQYELNYTTILGCLEAAQIPFRTADRPDWSTPLLIAGGPGTGNPLPLAPFFDAFTIGDGEELLIDVMDVMAKSRRESWSKDQTRQALAKIEGMFVPGISTFARKRIVDITKRQDDVAPLIPYIQTVHDRVVVEARRGCDRMCRFCQPCFINLPVREQSVDAIKTQALADIEKTGYEECSLLSLSIADYTDLKPLIFEVTDALAEVGASVSLPSQRADRFNVEIAEAVQQIRKSTLTFAPEAGTERLRAVINKNLSEEEILHAVESAYKSGWNKVKLYFMIGLPTERDEDLLGIADLVKKMQIMCQTIKRDKALSLKKSLEVNVTLSNFVPKPHTPFQWFGQDTMAELNRKRAFLREAFRSFKGVKLNFTDPEISKLECLISKGDERMADVIEGAYRKGDYLSAWEENLLFPQWFETLTELGLDVDTYTATAYTKLDEPLPWGCIHNGLEPVWLKMEYEKALQMANSDPCFVGCNTCGVCPEFGVQPVFMQPTDEANIHRKPAVDRAQLFPKPTHRVRLTLQKTGTLRFISHLDWLRMLQRALSRAQIPVAFTQGFNPKPMISFGPALPLFVEGHAELLDLAIADDQLGDPLLMDRLNEALPEGGKILSVQRLAPGSGSIDKLLRSMKYVARRTCETHGSVYTLHNRVNDLLALPQWELQIQAQQGLRQLDIKPWITDLQVTPDDDLQFVVRYEHQQTQLKPQWLLDFIDPGQTWALYRVSLGLDETLKSPAAKVIEQRDLVTH